MSEPRNNLERAMTERLGAPQGAPIPSRDMADALERMAHAKRFWLADFGHGRRKRPDHEIAQKRQELDVLQQAAFDYRAREKRFSVSAKDGSAEGGATA